LLKKVKKFFARCRILSTFATRSGRKSGTFFEKQVQKEISKKVEINFGRYLYKMYLCSPQIRKAGRSFKVWD